MTAQQTTKPPAALQRDQGQETKAFGQGVVVSHRTDQGPAVGTLHAEFLDRMAAVEWGRAEGYRQGWRDGRAALRAEARHAEAARTVARIAEFPPARRRGQAA